MRIQLRWCLFVLALWPALWGPLPAVRAQEAAAAVLLAPLEGVTVSGRVPITGTATHPQLVRYELAFGYSPNPTDSWFSIQEPAATAVVNDVLGYWDTAPITDGLYTLRLRVYWSDKDYLEAMVRNVRVQNTTAPLPTAPPAAPTEPPPTPTERATQPVIELPATLTPAATASGFSAATPAPADFPPSNTPRLDRSLLGRAFLEGVRWTGLIFALLAVYLGLKTLWRRLWSYLRSRR